jgi:iron complex outermembrane receptor protein
VNVVLRRDYSGIETRISYDNSFSGNSSTRRADLGAGFSLEKGKSNILLALSYSDANSLRLSDRDFIERGRAHIRANNPDFFFAPTSPPPLGQTPNIRSVSGAPLFGPGTPSFTTVPVGYAGGGGVAPLETNAGNYNLNAANTAQVGGGGARSLTNAPTLKSGMATFRRQFGSRVQGFLEVSASDNAGEFVLSGAASSTFTIAPTAPNNPFGQAIQVTIPIPESASVQFSNNQVRRAVGGAIVRLPNNWSAGADFTWSTNRTVVRDLPPGTMSAQAVAAIQNGSIDVLRDLNAFPIDFTDMLAPPTQMSPTKSTLRAGMIRAAGPTRSILGITPIISTSIEYRREFFDESRSISPTSVTLRPSKSQTTKSAYAEARLPLVAPDRAATGVKELELQVAVRHDDYTTNGVTGSVVEGSTTPIVRAKNKTESTNPTFALRYAPIADLALRASYGTGFLPPSVSQLAPSRLTTAQTVVDPRRGGSLTTLPAGQVLTGGNPDLDPEESKSWSAGLIFTPRLLPGLRLSVDYIHVEKTDEITSPFANVQDVVDRESIFPDRVVRAEPALGDPFGVGPIIEVRRTLVNVARTEVEAIDAALDFRSASTAAGTFTFYALATWQPHFKTQLISTAPVEEWVGVAAFNPLKVKINAGITWERDGWNVGWHSRYFHSYLVADPSLAFNQSTTIPNQGGDGRVPSQMYHDVVVSYRPAPGRSFLGTSVLAKTEFRAGVRNVFNKKPPFDASDTIRYYSPFGDPRLATYHLSVSKQF